MSLHQLLRQSFMSLNQEVRVVPKGYCAVYVGEIQKKRFVIPISYLNQPSFRELLRQAEEEFSYHHPMGGLTIQCREDIFANLVSSLNKP